MNPSSQTIGKSGSVATMKINVKRATANPPPATPAAARVPPSRLFNLVIPTIARSCSRTRKRVTLQPFSVTYRRIFLEQKETKKTKN